MIYHMMDDFNLARRVSVPMSSQEALEQPLLSEFGDHPYSPAGFTWIINRLLNTVFRLFGIAGDHDIRPKRAAFLFASLGTLAVFLSVAGRAALLTVNIRGLHVQATRLVGYVFDLSAGPFFAVFAPAIIYAGLRLIEEFQDDLRDLTKTEKPTLESAGALNRGDPISALLVISEANRRVFSPLVLAGLLVGSFGFTFGQEFWPGDDRYTIPFGYIQADKMAQYGTHMPLPRPEVMGRRVDRIGEFDRAILGTPDTLELDTKINGPTGNRVYIFYIFVITALTTHALFATLVFWILLKIGFILWIYTASIAKGCELDAIPSRALSSVLKQPLPSLWPLVIHKQLPFAESPLLFEGLAARVNPYDSENAFGLKPLLESVIQIRLFLTLCIVTLFFEATKNIGGYWDLVQKTDKRLWHIASIDSIMKLRGPGGAGFFAIGALALIFLFLILAWKYTGSYRSKLMVLLRQDGDQKRALRRQKIGVIGRILQISVGPVTVGSGVNFWIFGHIFPAALYWGLFCQKLFD